VEVYEIKPSAGRKEAKREQREDRSAGAAHGVGGSSRASLHAKTMVFDRQAIFIGSMNLDPRSVFTNTEIGVVVEQPVLIGQALERFDRELPEVAFRVHLRDGGVEWTGRDETGETRYTQEPETGAWQRFKVWFYSLWPIEPLL
jgi:putative cardiolipin synthase